MKKQHFQTPKHEKRFMCRTEKEKTPLTLSIYWQKQNTKNHSAAISQNRMSDLAEI